MTIARSEQPYNNELGVAHPALHCAWHGKGFAGTIGVLGLATQIAMPFFVDFEEHRLESELGEP